MLLTDTFAASDDVVCREVGGEMMLLNLASGIYFGLNEVGGRVWQFLDERPCSLGEICDLLMADFEVEREVVESDIRELFAKLVEHELLVRVEA